MPFALPVLSMVAAASSTSVAPFTMHLTILPLTYSSTTAQQSKQSVSAYIA
jgi:hypothetical protein